LKNITTGFDKVQGMCYIGFVEWGKVMDRRIDKTDKRQTPMEHRLNYGRLWPDTLFKADCSCGWTTGKGSRDAVIAAVREHEKLIPETAQ